MDRLALWLGGVADPDATRRFVRVPPSMADQPVILRSTTSSAEPEERHHPPKRNEHVSILDAALLESGLMEAWLARVAPNDEGRWACLRGDGPNFITNAHCSYNRATNDSFRPPALSLIHI